MKDQLKDYVDLLFAGAQNADDVKQEILQNTLDRYDDLVAQGKTPQAAYQLAISGIGDINELLMPQRQEPTPPIAPAPTRQKTPTDVKHPNQSNSLASSICWIAGIALYFILSFATSAWYITWVIFCMIPCVTGIINGFLNIRSRTASALIKIILLALLLLVLVAVLVVGILGGSVSIGYFAFDGLPGGTEARSGAVDAAGVDSVEVRWVAGSITIQKANVDQITFEEEPSESSDPKLAWKQDGGTLIIAFLKKSTWQLGISSSPGGKDLVILIPETWTGEEITINSVSARIRVDNLSASDFALSSVSGNCTFTDCDIENLETETVSGDIKYTGALSEFSVEAVSADCTLNLTNRPRSLSLDAVSGDMTAYLPADCGFTASIDSVSGDFSSDFATTKQSGRYIFGTGECKITADSVSGDIRVYTN